MATPLVASWRINLKYFVQGQYHHLRVYVKAFTDGSSFVVHDSEGVSISIADAIRSVANSLKKIQGTTGGASGVETGYLEQLVGVEWQTRVVITNPATVAANALSPQLGWQSTLVYLDNTFKKVKVVIAEPAGAGLEHTNTQNSSVGGQQGINYYWNNPADVSDTPVIDFMVGRSNNYLANTGWFLAGTMTPNREFRRHRGLV